MIEIDKTKLDKLRSDFNMKVINSNFKIAVDFVHFTIRVCNKFFEPYLYYQGHWQSSYWLDNHWRPNSIAEDSMDEGISLSLKEYQASTRRVIIPEGYTYEGVRFQDPNGQWKKVRNFLQPL